MNRQTGYPSVDKPWMKYYCQEPISVPIPNNTLYDYLWECSKDKLDFYALDYFGNKITYRKMFKMIDEVAKAFIAIGVKEKDIVPIVSVSTVASVVCLYAINKIGAVADYINVLSEKKDYKGYFEEADARVVVTLDLFAEKVVSAANESGVKKVVIFGVDYEMPSIVKVGYKLKTVGKYSDISKDEGIVYWKDFLKLGVNIDMTKKEKNPKEMCILAHTGGTTGKPKAVMISDYAMNCVVSDYYMIYNSSDILKESEANSVFLQVMVPFVVYGLLTCMHMPLCMGWCLALIPKFDGDCWKSYVSKYHFAYTFAVPAYITCMIESEDMNMIDLSKIRTLAMGGEGMTESLEKEVNLFLKKHNCEVEIVKGYGLSEVSATAISTFPGVNKIGSVGIPLYHNNIMIYDNEQDCELKYGEVGEICLECSSQMIGYMNDEEATKQLIRKHKNDSVWLHTGDLGSVDDDGFVFVVGRMKRLILTINDGITYKVNPKETESILEKNCNVKKSCIVGSKDGNNQVLKAFVVLNEEKELDYSKIESELKALCCKELPSYARPTFYQFVNSLPLTSAGKVDYRKLESDY